MIVDLSIFDLLSLMGSDAIALRTELDNLPQLKEVFSKKEAYTTERLRASGMLGDSYVADLLEGKAGIADPPDVLADKIIKLGWIRKSIKEEYIAILKGIPTYILVGITSTVNKELGSKR